MTMDAELEGALRCVLERIERDPATQLTVLAAVHAKLNHPLEIERLIDGAPDRIAAWKHADIGVKVALGSDLVLTQHGFSQSLCALSSESVSAILGGITCFLATLQARFGIQCYFTSGTLLGLVRSGQLIAHDDDIDTAYVSCEMSLFNVMLERKEIIRFINRMAGHRAEDHLPGLIHCYIPLGGTQYRFDLFTAWVEEGCIAEYPLPRATLATESVLPLGSESHYGVDVPFPADPKRLLEVNYGTNWSIPDPTFRFDWEAAGKAYGNTLVGFSWSGTKSLRGWLTAETDVLSNGGQNTKFEKVWREAVIRTDAPARSREVVWITGEILSAEDAAALDLSEVDPHQQPQSWNSAAGYLFLGEICNYDSAADAWLDYICGVNDLEDHEVRAVGRLRDGTLVLKVKRNS